MNTKEYSIATEPDPSLRISEDLKKKKATDTVNIGLKFTWAKHHFNIMLMLL